VHRRGVIRPVSPVKRRHGEPIGLVAGALLRYVNAAVAALVGRLADSIVVWLVVSTVILGSFLLPMIAIAKAFTESPTKDKAAFDRLSDGQKKGFHPATTKDWDATIELIKFVDNLRKKKAS